MVTERQLLSLVGSGARAVDRSLIYPPDSILPEVRVCDVCSGPVSGQYRLCYDCQNRKRTFGTELADEVVPLSYAVSRKADLQRHYSDLFQYKSSVSAQGSVRRLQALTALFEINHLECLERKIGAPVSEVIPVPSGRGRNKSALVGIAGMLWRSMGEANYVGTPRNHRPSSTNPADFAIDKPVSGHVVIFEDTWVRGHNSQALAIQARRRGADRVSIVTLARLLDYNYPLTQRIARTSIFNAPYDPRLCPVFGVRHSSGIH